jgi:glycosyltransferase involved in cell wall biosynthesis
MTNSLKKIKLLFVHHAASWGGAPNSMIKLINGLDKNKFSVRVLLLKNSIVAEKLSENNINYQIAKSLFYRKFYSYFNHSEAMNLKWYQIHYFIKSGLSWLLSKYYFASKELSGFDYDIVHLNSSVLTDWLLPVKKSGGKVIIHIREPFRKGKFDLLHKFFTHQMQIHANKIIAISQNNAKRINILEKTSVIYNYSEIPTDNSPEMSYYNKEFLYLGGIAKNKGFYSLIEALDYLDDDIKILFGGNYSNNKNIKSAKALVRNPLGFGKKQRSALLKMKNHKNVVEIGLIHNVSAYLKKTCCLISPFTKPHFARPVIEAFLLKKTAIASDVDGMDEIITNNVDGLLFKTNDAKALAEAINYIAKHPLKAKEMGEHGYKTAIQKYTPSNIKAIISIYNSL